jgi:hypothetical protein
MKPNEFFIRLTRTDTHERFYLQIPRSKDTIVTEQMTWTQDEAAAFFTPSSESVARLTYHALIAQTTIPTRTAFQFTRIDDILELVQVMAPMPDTYTPVKVVLTAMITPDLVKPDAVKFINALVNRALLPPDYIQPDWTNGRQTKCWRNHIDGTVRDAWTMFDVDTRALLAFNAQRLVVARG